MSTREGHPYATPEVNKSWTHPRATNACRHWYAHEGLLSLICKWWLIFCWLSLLRWVIEHLLPGPICMDLSLRHSSRIRPGPVIDSSASHKNSTVHGNMWNSKWNCNSKWLELIGIDWIWLEVNWNWLGLIGFEWKWLKLIEIDWSCFKLIGNFCCTPHVMTTYIQDSSQVASLPLLSVPSRTSRKKNISKLKEFWI